MASRVRRWIAAALLAGAVAMSMVASPAEAASFGRAGVVVVHGDGTVEVDCVALERNVSSGFRLLKESRFKYEAARFPFGPAICWLDGEGVHTNDPDECFSDPEGQFWGYWTQDKGETAPAESAVGMTERRVRRGSVDYWVWGSWPQEAPEPMPFKEICAR